MGRYMKQYDKDYMKMAMLKQEETFRHQVQELHQLYQVQKLLMDKMKAELKRQRKSSNTRRRNTETNTDDTYQQCKSYQNQRRPSQALELKPENDGGASLEIEEENDLELRLATGSNSSSSTRRKESSFTSDSGASFSSSSSESGGGVKVNGSNWGLFQVQDVSLGSYQSEERMKQSPWLFQCLGLNLT